MTAGRGKGAYLPTEPKDHKTVSMSLFQSLQAKVRSVGSCSGFLQAGVGCRDHGSENPEWLGLEERFNKCPQAPRQQDLGQSTHPRSIFLD